MDASISLATTLSVIALAVAILGVITNLFLAKSSGRSAKAAEGSMGIAKVSADAAKESVIESRMARQDQFGTDVFIQFDQKLGTRWIATRNFAQVGPAEPMKTVLNWPGNDIDRVLVGVVLKFVNRSPLDAVVHIGSARVDGISAERRLGAQNESPAYGVVESLLIDGRFSMLPNSECLMLVRQGPTLAEWRENHDAPIIVNIGASRSVEGAVQRWRLALTGALLGQELDNESAYRVQPFLQVDAELKLLSRFYPNLDDLSDE
jgi:hypothetical protein